MLKEHGKPFFIFYTYFSIQSFFIRMRNGFIDHTEGYLKNNLCLNTGTKLNCINASYFCMSAVD